ncbi:MAG: hypothetical protein AAF587_02305 [Bacteroidota bacterium]
MRTLLGIKIGSKISDHYSFLGKSEGISPLFSEKDLVKLSHNQKKLLEGKLLGSFRLHQNFSILIAFLESNQEIKSISVNFEIVNEYSFGSFFSILKNEHRIDELSSMVGKKLISVKKQYPQIRFDGVENYVLFAPKCKVVFRFHVFNGRCHYIRISSN